MIKFEFVVVSPFGVAFCIEPRRRFLDSMTLFTRPLTEFKTNGICGGIFLGILYFFSVFYPINLFKIQKEVRLDEL